MTCTDWARSIRRSARALVFSWCLCAGSIDLTAATGIAPVIGPWGHNLCYGASYCYLFRRECAIWKLGTQTSKSSASCGYICTDQQDPTPWREESKLLPKASTWFSEPAAWSRYWLLPGEINNDLAGRCWSGGPGFTLGIESVNFGTITSPTNKILKARRDRTVTCPGSTSWSSTAGACLRPAGGLDPYKNNHQCPVAPTDATRNNSNPINTFTGAKLQVETDYRGHGALPLHFTRYFSDGSVRSSVATVFSESGMGPHWGHTYARKIVHFDNGTLIAATAYRPQGDRYHFNQVLVGTTPVWHGLEPDITDTLAQRTDDSGKTIWRYTAANGEVEIYDFASGRLLSITNPAGQRQTLTYGADGKLAQVSDLFGRQLEFTYHTGGIGRGLLASVTATSDAHPGQGARFAYDYLNSSRHGTTVMLHQVRFPDATPGNDADNPVKEYRYNETVLDDPAGFVFAYNADPEVEIPVAATANFPRFMTGIIDENGQRYATFKYRTYLIAGGGYKNTLAYLSGHGTQSNGVYADQFKVRSYYTEGGNPISVDALGVQRKHLWQVQFGVAKQTGIEGAVCASCGGESQAITYDPATGFLTSRTDFNGNLTRYAYQANGLESCQVEGFTTLTANAPLMRKTTTQWDAALRRITARTIWRYVAGQFTSTAACDAPAVNWSQVKTTTNSYANGRLTARTATDFTVHPSVSRTTTFTYTAAGLVDVVDGPRSEVSDRTDYNYDAQGNLTQIVRNTGARSLITSIPQYDLSGRPLQIVDPNGVVTTLTYHPRGWLTQRTVAGATTTFGYDNVGQLTRITTPTGAFLDYDYDAAHRLIRIRDNLNNQVEFTLDALGNLLAEKVYDATGALARQASAVFNALNQLEQSINGLGDTTHFTYDANGQRQRTIDPRDPAPRTPTIFSEDLYDALKRVRQVRDPLGGRLTTTYDVLDNLATVTDARGLVTRFTYNGFGEMTEQVSPDSGVTTYHYDAAGNRLRRTDARGVVVNYHYDALNRITRIDYPSDVDVVMTYDESSGGPGAKGRLTTMVDESGTTRYHYDARGNVLRKTQHNPPYGSHALHYAYDAADNLTRVTYPSGMVVSYARDAAERITAVTAATSSSTQLAREIEYEPFGPVREVRLGNGLHETRRYDLAGRLASIAAPGRQHQTYTYDAANNLVAISDALRVNQGEGRYTYDLLDRLTAKRSSAIHTTYSYDATGNRTRFTYDVGRGLSNHGYFVAPTSNRLERWFSPWGPPVRYDATGNLLKNTETLTTYTYNNAGRLRSAVVSGYGIPRYYNGHGQRTVKLMFPIINQKRVFVYDEAGHLLSEAVYGGTNQREAYREFVWLGERPLAQYENVAPAPGLFTASKLAYFHTNHIERPLFMTNHLGAEVYREQLLEPFGGLWGYNGNGPNPDPDGDGVKTETPLGLPGQYWDWDALAYYNYYRDYDGKWGRYMQADPIGLAGGINLYRYANNNPLRFVDPFGLDVQFCFSPKAAHGLGHIGFGTSYTGYSEGFYPNGNPISSYGSVRRDNQEDLQCKTVDTEQETDECMRKCQLRRITDPGRYRLATRQCTEFVRSCAIECGLTKDPPSGPRPGPLYRDLPGTNRP